jgi:hypothetical protein
MRPKKNPRAIPRVLLRRSVTEPARRRGPGRPHRRDPGGRRDHTTVHNRPARSVTFSFDPTTPISVTRSNDLTGSGRSVTLATKRAGRRAPANPRAQKTMPVGHARAETRGRPCLFMLPADAHYALRFCYTPCRVVCGFTTATPNGCIRAEIASNMSSPE